MRIDITVKTFEVALNGHPFADDMALSSPTPVKVTGRYRSRMYDKAMSADRDRLPRSGGETWRLCTPRTGCQAAQECS